MKIIKLSDKKFELFKQYCEEYKCGFVFSSRDKVKPSVEAWLLKNGAFRLEDHHSGYEQFVLLG